MTDHPAQAFIERTLDCVVHTEPRRVLRDLTCARDRLSRAIASCAALPDERARSAYLLLIQASSSIDLAESIVTRYKARRATISPQRSRRRKIIDPGASQPPL